MNHMFSYRSLVCHIIFRLPLTCEDVRPRANTGSRTSDLPYEPNYNGFILKLCMIVVLEFQIVSKYRSTMHKMHVHIFSISDRYEIIVYVGT